MKDDACQKLSIERQENWDFQLAYRPPFDWPLLLDFLSRRAITGVETVTGDVYRRTVRVFHDDEWLTGWLSVKPIANQTGLAVGLSPSLSAAAPLVLERLSQLFDLTCQPALVNSALGDLAVNHPGLRVPGAFDGFEAAVRAILGQQITVRAACTLAGRVASTFGTRLTTPYEALTHGFPDAATLAAADADTLGGLGIIGTRVAAIQALARACVAGELQLVPDAPVTETLERLRAVPGIGDWTAQYLAMRALGWSDAFPAADHGVLKALGERSPARARQYAETWRPWRAYAVMHLWQSLGE